MKKRREMQAHAFKGNRYGWAVYMTPDSAKSDDVTMHEPIRRKVFDALAPYE